MLINAIEFDRETNEPTGDFQIYDAIDIQEAIEMFLIVRGLIGSGSYKIGPTGRVVHLEKLSYVFQVSKDLTGNLQTGIFSTN